MSQMKLGTKIIAGFIAVSVITLILGIIGYYGATTSEDSINGIGLVKLPSSDSLLTIKAGAENIRGTLRALAIPGLSQEMRNVEYANVESARNSYGDAWKTYETLPRSPEEEKLWQQFVQAWDALRTENNNFMELAKQFDENGIANPAELARQVERFTKDHYILVQKVLHILYTGDSVFEGGEDHTACNAGKFLPNFKTESQEFLSIIRDFSGPHQKFHEAVAKIKALTKSGDIVTAQGAYRTEMIPAMETVFKAFESMMVTANQSSEVMDKSQQHLLGVVMEKQTAAFNLLDQLVKINGDLANQDVAQATSQATFLKLFSLIAMIVGVVLALTLGIFIARGITRPIQRIIEALSSGSEQVGSASTQVSEASQELAEGASENAAALEETSSSLEEMASMTKQNADNASQANSLMGQTQHTVSRAAESMSQVTRSMNEISSSGKEIGKIIKTIDEIAFQTNLLALNAAVEAARAGEAGQGFAVVADEVRNLAQRAAEAAKNTSELIEGTIQRIDQGNQLVRTTDEAFKEVATNAGKVAELVSEIAAASNEQSQGIDQVNQAMTQMDKVTQQNAANAEESASASEELNAQAESMIDVVNDLNRLVSGASARTLGSSAVNRKPARRGLSQLPAPKAKNSGKAGANAHPPAKKVVKADDIIPMDDDFQDF